jgi:hypothetical protein
LVLRFYRKVNVPLKNCTICVKCCLHAWTCKVPAASTNKIPPSPCDIELSASVARCSAWRSCCGTQDGKQVHWAGLTEWFTRNHTELFRSDGSHWARSTTSQSRIESERARGRWMRARCTVQSSTDLEIAEFFLLVSARWKVLPSLLLLWSRGSRFVDRKARTFRKCFSLC